MKRVVLMAEDCKTAMKIDDSHPVFTRNMKFVS